MSELGSVNENEDPQRAITSNQGEEKMLRSRPVSFHDISAKTAPNFANLGGQNSEVQASGSYDHQG